MNAALDMFVARKTIQPVYARLATRVTEISEVVVRTA